MKTNYPASCQELDYNRQPPPARYSVDLSRAGVVWEHEYNSLNDLFSTTTKLHDKVIISPTHTLGQTEDGIRVIAYNNPGLISLIADESDQKDLARYIYPGEFAIAIKHHCPKPNPKRFEQIKLQCTHTQAAIGVNWRGKRGVISISAPQRYHRQKDSSRRPLGLFGSENYPSIFIKPQFPDSLPVKLKRQYVDNIRTWLVIANTFTVFPARNIYNGYDPLATTDLEKVKLMGDNLLLALTGDALAEEWLADPLNQVYCGELVHIALNLGIHFPINKTMLGGKRYRPVKQALESKEFLDKNKNQYVRRVHLQLAPETLHPITEYIEPPSENGETAFDPLLAIQPFTMVENLEKYIRKTIPREVLGEEVALFQRQLLEKVKPVFLRAMRLDTMAENHPTRIEIEKTFQQVLQIVGKQHRNYAEYSRALRPFLLKIHQHIEQIEGAINAFIPPHCYLVRATNSIEGKPGQGILGWQYLGHGLHENMLVPKEPR